MTTDEQRLTDAGWVKNAAGTWTLTKAFEGYNARRQLQHIPAGVTRDLAGAVELESIRTVEPDPRLEKSAVAATASAAAWQTGMEKIESRNKSSAPEVGAPTTTTPTKEETK